MNSTEINGTVRNLTGRVKDGFGGLTGDAATQAEGKLDQVAGTVQRQAGNLADGAAEVADNVADRAADFAGRARATLRDAAEVVSEEARNVGAKVYDAGAKAGEVVGDTVKQAPLLSLLGMAALGYLTAFLVHSASSPLAPPPPPVKLRWKR